MQLLGFFMKVIFTLFLLVLSALSFHQSVYAKETTTSEATSPSTLPVYSKVYDYKRDPFKDAVAAIKLASETNRNVLIEIGGNWCTWCHKMDAFLDKNPEVFQALHKQYVLLKISVSDTNENEAFMKSLPPVLGYPHMYVSTGTGKMVLSKDTAELQEDGRYSKQRWLTFLDAWQSSKTKG